MDWGTIAVGCRIGGAPDPMFVSNLMRLVTRGLRNNDYVLDPTIELPHHYAAECMVNNFIKCKADTLLMLDDDMIFAGDDLEKLRSDKDGFKHDMLGALYQSRKPPHNPLCIVNDPKSPTGFSNVSLPAPDCILDVGILGLGFTLVRRSIIKKIAKMKPEKEMMFYWGKCGDSEDAGFCKRVAAAGGTLGVSTRVSVGHRMGLVLRWDAVQGGAHLFARGMEAKT